IRADDADAVATGDLDAEVAHHGEAAIALGDAPCLDHLPARLSRLLHRELHVAGCAVGQRVSALAAKREQALEAALVALPARAHAVAEPVLLLHDAAVELVAGNLLGLEDRIAPGLEAGKAVVEPPRDAAVEPDGGLGKSLQETPVVADQHHG